MAKFIALEDVLPDVLRHAGLQCPLSGGLQTPCISGSKNFLAAVCRQEGRPRVVILMASRGRQFARWAIGASLKEALTTFFGPLPSPERLALQLEGRAAGDGSSLDLPLLPYIVVGPGGDQTLLRQCLAEKEKIRQEIAALLAEAQRIREIRRAEAAARASAAAKPAPAAPQTVGEALGLRRIVDLCQGHPGLAPRVAKVTLEPRSGLQERLRAVGCPEEILQRFAETLETMPSSGGTN